MSRSDAMAERLSPVYDTGPASLLSQLLDQLGLHIEEIDEERLRVQRSHWLDTAVDRTDVARIGALLDRPLEAWELTDLFRDHIKAIAAARLAGGVAAGPIMGFVDDLLTATVRRLGIRIDAAAPGGARLHANPLRTKRFVVGAVTPLAWMDLDNEGLDAVPIDINLVARSGTRAAVPVLADPDRGRLLGWAGVIPAGSRLRIRTHVDGSGFDVRAHLDGRDVSDLLFSTNGFSPGQSLDRSDIVQPAEPLLVEPGPHRLWYITAGLFDRPELDAVMFGVARRSLRQGRFDEDEFADALFHQDPTMHLELFWSTPERTAFHVEVPAGAMTADPPLWTDRETARERIEVILDHDVNELRAVGVRSDVRFHGFHDSMPLTDRVSPGAQRDLSERAPLAPSPTPEFGALLDLTPMDRSRLE